MAGAFKSLRKIDEVLELSEDEDHRTSVREQASCTGEVTANGGTRAGSADVPRPPARLSQAKRARQAEKEDLQKAASSAMSKAAEATFQRLLDADDGTCITPEALRKALVRFRVPADVCKPEDAEDLLEIAAEQAEVSGPLNLENFKKLFKTLNLKVTRDGRVW